MNRSLITLLVLLVLASVVVEASAQSARPGPKAQAEVLHLSEARAAAQALDALLRAYEQGDLVGVRGFLDPGFIGYQVFLDGVQRDLHTQRLIRVHLEQPRITAGADVAVIQAGWTKRYFDAVTFRPELTSGQVTVLMHRTPASWQLAAIHGDSPFSTEPAQRFPSRGPSSARIVRPTQP